MDHLPSTPPHNRWRWWKSLLQTMGLAFALWGDLFFRINPGFRKTPFTDYVAPHARFFRPTLKDRLGTMVSATAFWGVLLAGLWLIVSGFYDGPNYAASHWVTIDQVETITWKDRNNTGHYWLVHYHYIDEKGAVLSGKRYVRSDAPPAEKKAAKAHGGDELLLEIPVAASDSHARWGINDRVYDGVVIVEILLMVGYFTSEGLWKIDSKTGQIVPSKLHLLKFMLIFLGVAFGTPWLILPLIPSAIPP